jgi:hypothetical protein
MLDQFCATLEAISSERDCYRAYRIEAGTDLLGDWVVEITFGRIGRAGHQVRYCVSSETAARKLVKTTLAKRATAKRRIGVRYQFREVSNPRNWVNLSSK